MYCQEFFFFNFFILFYFGNLMERYHLYSYLIFLKPISLKTSVLNAEHFRVVIRKFFSIKQRIQEMKYHLGEKESNEASSTYNICSIEILGRPEISL